MAQRLDTLIYELEAHTQGFDKQIANAKKTLGDFTGWVAKNPTMAVGALGAAFVALGIHATKAAAAIDTELRRIRANTGATVEDLQSLGATIRELSLVSPRSQVELAQLAVSISEMGETDPAQIERTMRAIVLGADAVGDADLAGQAKLIDNIRWQFDLTADAARNAYLQIVAMAQGRQSLGPLADGVAQLAPVMNAMGATAIQTAEGVAALIDGGIQLRDVTAGVHGVLQDASTAGKRAAEVDGERQQALQALAKTVNQTTLQERGLLGVLADLHRSLDGSASRYAAAGLSQKQMALGAAALAAEERGVTKETLSATDARKKLEEAAKTNRESAEALVKILKSELNAALIDLGNVLLPLATKGLNAMADAMIRARRETRELVNAIAVLQEQEKKWDEGGVRGRMGEASFRQVAAQQARQLAAKPANAEVLNKEQVEEYLRLFERFQQALGSRTFFNAPEFDAVAEALSVVRGRLVALAEPVEEVGDAFKKVPPATTTDTINDLTAAVKRAQEAFKDALTRVQEFSAGLNDRDAVSGMEKQQRQLVAALEEAITKLPKAQQAAARAQAGTILGQLAEEGEKFRQTRAAEITTDLAKVLAQVSGDAVEQLRQQYADLVKQVEAYADEAERTGTVEGRLTAERARGAIPSIKAKGDQLVKLTELQKEFEEAVKMEGVAYAAVGDQVFASLGMRVNLLATYAEQEKKVREIIADQTISTEVRIAAEKLLNEILAKRGGIEGSDSPAPELDKSAKYAQKIGAGIRDAAQHAMSLVQILGEGRSELAATLSAVMSIGSGISQAGAILEKSGGFGNAMKSATGVIAMLGSAGAIAGGLISLGRGLFGESEAQKKARATAEKNTQAIEALRLRIGDVANLSLGGGQVMGVQGALDQMIARITSIMKSGSGPDAVMKQLQGVQGEFERMLRSQGLTMADVTGLAEELKIELDGSAGSYVKLRDALRGMDFSFLEKTLAGLTRRDELLRQAAGQSDDPTIVLRDQLNVFKTLAPVLGGVFDAALLETEAGRNQLRDQIASLLRDALTLDPNSAAAKALYGSMGELNTQDFLSLLSSILTGLDGFTTAVADTAAKLDRALGQFRDRAAILGLSAEQVLAELVAIYAGQFDDLEGLLDGIDITAEGGLEALQERIRTIFTALHADGELDEAEQKVVDALLAILGAASQAADGIESAAQRLRRAWDEARRAFDTDNDILGGDARTQFGRMVGGAAGISDALAAILGDLDLESADGIEAAKQALRDFYAEFAIDGIDESEQVLVDAIKALLGGLGAIGREIADEEAAKIAAQREAVRAQIKQAQEDIDTLGLTGVDAFKRTVAGYGDAFADLLETFDLGSAKGVEDARKALRELLEGVRLGAVDLEAFAGMTEDEVLAAILALTNGLGRLGDEADRTAKAAEDAARAARDLAQSIEGDYLRALGREQEADLLDLDQWIADQLAKAIEAGLGEDALEKIRATGRLRRQGILDRYAPAASAGPDTGTGVDAQQRFVASAITQATELSVLKTNDFLASLLVEERGSRGELVEIRKLLGLMSTAFPSVTPRFPVPAAAFGAGNGGAPTGGPTFITNLYITLPGPVDGMSPRQAAEELVRHAAPLLNEVLGRAAGVDKRAGLRR